MEIMRGLEDRGIGFRSLTENIDTGSATYIRVVTNRKAAEDQGKVRLIIATACSVPTRKSLSSKRKEISDQHIADIVNLYLDNQRDETVQVFEPQAFGYRKITVDRPLRLNVDLAESEPGRFRSTSELDEYFLWMESTYGEDVAMRLKAMKAEVTEHVEETEGLALSPDKSAKAVKQANTGTLQPHATHVHTTTYDNGKEFAHHTEIADALDAEGYFAHPYHAWEPGLNENMNGLIRQYLPKGKSFDSLTQHDIRCIMDKLNNRPRKCLGYKNLESGILRDKPTSCTNKLNPGVFCEILYRFIRRVVNARKTRIDWRYLTTNHPFQK